MASVLLLVFVHFSILLSITWRLFIRSSTLFYAFNPILLISVHGGMNEPLFFASMFAALYYFRIDNFKFSAISLAFASLARPDFVIRLIRSVIHSLNVFSRVGVNANAIANVNKGRHGHA